MSTPAASTEGQRPPQPRPTGRTSPLAVAGALLRYRIVAYVVGVGLVVLVCVGVPLKYLADNASVVAVVGPAHGFLYMVYLLAVADLSLRIRWSPLKTVLVMLAGTIPFLSFVAERYVTGEVRAGQP